MSWDYDNNEFDHELDEKFLKKYGNTKSTIDDADDSIFDDDDDYDNLWQNTEEDAPPLETQVDEKPTLIINNLEQKREDRRNYQSRYRAGEIKPARARLEKRKQSKGSKSIETRQKVSYYLPIALKEEISRVSKLEGIQRRIIAINALESLLSSNTPHSELPFSDIPLKDRKFQFDEIPNDLWDRLDRYCRNGSGKRTIHIYQVMEAAYSLAMRKNNKNGK